MTIADSASPDREWNQLDENTLLLRLSTFTSRFFTGNTERVLLSCSFVHFGCPVISSDLDWQPANLHASRLNHILFFLHPLLLPQLSTYLPPGPPSILR